MRYLSDPAEKMNGSKRNYMIYGTMLAVFGLLMWWVVRMGEAYDTSDVVAVRHADSSVDLLRETLASNLTHPVPLLLLQIIAILVAVRIFSYLFKYLGQPGVIGEIVAGIVLGPSVLGHFFPGAFEFLFEPSSLVPLNVISQIGLVLFMFVIGMELDLGVVRRKASETLVISHASIIVPFFLGLVLAYWVYPEFGAHHAPFLSFALFIGISVSITAFPVLARIVQERNLGKTPMGMLAIASAANNDVTAWCLLAAVIAVAKAGDAVGALYTIALTAVYILFMFCLARPFLRKIGELYNKRETVGKTLVAFIFLVLILSSYITEVLGIHALFGAFLAGVIMPDNLSFRRVMTEKVEDVAVVLFLPLFFVFTGLRTEIGLLNTPHLWGVCALFIVMSIAGKLLGATLSARAVGESWKDSLSIGVLMNTRGLMELIVLNIGYEMGIIPGSLFVIFVIMALFTTYMATPLLSLIEKLFARESRAKRPTIHRYPRILISFANPESGPVFLKLVNLLYGRMIGGAKVTAVHYTIGTDTSPLNAYDYSKGSFAPLRAEADRLGLRIDTRYRVTDRYVEDRFRTDGSGAQLHPQLSRTGAPHAACRGRVPCRRTVAPAQLALPRGAFAR
ncbi:cation:proton antiporter [Alistipes ihumii]|uniref:cation:proton antiporter n=1 Tax=Alistipes ihumii TaxID=1470347 RepID=UPI003078D5BD